MEAAHIGIEGIVHVWQRVRTEGVVHGHLADAEVVPRGRNVDAEDLVHVG
jgi:hypothetical protein